MYTARRICRVRSCVKSWLQFFSRRLYFFCLGISINNVHDNLAVYSENKGFLFLEFTFGIAFLTAATFYITFHYDLWSGENFFIAGYLFCIATTRGSKTFKCIESKWEKLDSFIMATLESTQKLAEYSVKHVVYMTYLHENSSAHF